MPFTDMHDISRKRLRSIASSLKAKPSARVNVAVSMSFQAPLSVERYVGGGLNQHIESARVKLTNPDVTVHLAEDDRLLLIKGRYEGIGGFPDWHL